MGYNRHERTQLAGINHPGLIISLQQAGGLQGQLKIAEFTQTSDLIRILAGKVEAKEADLYAIPVTGSRGGFTNAGNANRYHLFRGKFMGLAAGGKQGKLGTVLNKRRQEETGASHARNQTPVKLPSVTQGHRQRQNRGFVEKGDDRTEESGPDIDLGPDRFIGQRIKGDFLAEFDETIVDREQAEFPGRSGPLQE